MTIRTFHVVVACSLDNGIGVGPKIPWRIPRDTAHFERVSKEILHGTYPSHCRNAVILGRDTYLGIPVRMRPLAGRLNIVLTSNEEFIKSLPEDVLSAKSLDAALDLLSTRMDIADIFICGGTRLYAEAVQHPSCGRVYLTRVHVNVPNATAHFPSLFAQDIKTITAAGWRRCTHEELQADMLRRRRITVDSTTTTTSTSTSITTTSTTTTIQYDDYPEGVLINERDGTTFEFQLYERIN
ncbi:dihydrofolate reductase-like domain-containing protein [Syncephalis plumigaleata]|nr:dihydrofolate reductase-like domain-containing protein [Syncephalis plumigaleata]